MLKHLLACSCDCVATIIITIIAEGFYIRRMFTSEGGGEALVRVTVRLGEGG